MKELITKYLTASLSEEETIILRNWLQDPKNKEEFKSFVRTNRQLDLALRQIDTDKAFEKIMENISANRRPRNNMFRPMLKYAAIVMLLTATSFLLYQFLKRDVPSQITEEKEIKDQITLELEDGSLQILEENAQMAIINNEGGTIANQVQGKISYDHSQASVNQKLVYNQLTVPYGKRFSVELADGTLVYLNAGTKFRYPRYFSDPENREVYLDGEAMFTVQRDESKPFVVHTEKMNVRVLGTQFNVSSYRNENNTSAVLIEGSVAVYRPNEEFDGMENIILSPKQQAMVEQERITVQEVNIQKHIAWTSGKLYFVNDSFNSIIKELERHFNIIIENNYEELNRVRYTGTFESETIDQILETFKKNSPFNYSRINEKIIIEPSS